MGSKLVENAAMPPALLDDVRAAQFLGLGRRTLQNWRVQGVGPRFLRIGRSVRYSMADLLEYCATRRFHSTSEADQRVAAKAAA